MQDLNRTFVAAITREGCTVEEYQAALHAYLTDPSRKQRVSCYCVSCKQAAR